MPEIPSVVNSVPEEFRSSLTKGLKIIFENIEGIKAVALVGSVPQGDWEDDSDLDLLFVTVQKPNYKILLDINLLLEDTNKHVQLIWFYEDQLEQNFIDCTTMAHSLKNGLIIYDPNLLLQTKCNQLSDLPTVEWMYSWFKHFDDIYFIERKYKSQRYYNHRSDMISNNMARVVVNLAILFLESRGIVPTTKKKIRQGISGVKPELSTAAEQALIIRKQDLFMDWEQFCLMGRTARYLRKELISFFRNSLKGENSKLGGDKVDD